MTIIPPITSNALHPIEFVPAVQDAETYKRIRVAENRAREQALDRDLAALQEQFDSSEIDEAARDKRLAQIDDERTAVVEDRAFIERTYATMKASYPIPQVFLISVPTSVEREQINSRLISLGLKQVTQEMIRATMIEELFNQDWSQPGEEITPEINETRAEDNGNFLDSMWLRQQAHDEALTRWKEQEVERLLDESNGAPARPREELPTKIITIREEARLQLLVDRMMTQSQRLRDLAAVNMDFGRRNAVLLVRMHLVGVEGFTPAIPIERNKHTRALSEEAVLALREQVDDASWNQLVTYIDQLYRVDGGEEKNSASPLGKPSLPSGSTEPSGDPATSDGSSTGSPSSPAPAAGSEMTTDKSSGSTSVSSMEPAPMAASITRTVEG